MPDNAESKQLYNRLMTTASYMEQTGEDLRDADQYKQILAEIAELVPALFGLPKEDQGENKAE